MISLNMVKLGKMVNLICNLIFMAYEQYWKERSRPANQPGKRKKICQDGCYLNNNRKYIFVRSANHKTYFLLLARQSQFLPGLNS